MDTSFSRVTRELCVYADLVGLLHHKSGHGHILRKLMYAFELSPMLAIIRYVSWPRRNESMVTTWTTNEACSLARKRILHPLLREPKLKQQSVVDHIDGNSIMNRARDRAGILVETMDCEHGKLLPRCA